MLLLKLRNFEAEHFKIDFSKYRRNCEISNNFSWQQIHSNHNETPQIEQDEHFWGHTVVCFCHMLAP